MSCIVPANQPIYQALIDKAAFYSTLSKNPYTKYANASYTKYTNAAHIILNTTTNIYSIASYCNSVWDFQEEIEDAINNIGPSIISFIFDFISSSSI